jgi:hypothetical protein
MLQPPYQYEGFPNGKVTDISPDGVVDIYLPSTHETVSRKVNQIKVRTGRSGSLDYICPVVLGLRADMEDRPQENGELTDLSNVTKYTLRERVSQCGFKLSDNVYAVGSLTGDTLVRFLFGGCLYVAKDLVRESVRV